MGKAVKYLWPALGVGLLMFNSSVAQHWETMLDDSVGFVYSASADSEKLILSDQLTTRAMPNQVFLFDGTNWSTIADSTVGQGSNPIRGAFLFQGVPYCYHYSSVNGSGVFRYDGSAWQLIGEMLTGNVWGMREYEDALYIFGAFREINGDTNLRQIVKYDGEHFTPVGTPLFYSTTSSTIVKDIHFYQGELYVVGDIKTASGKYHIARWDGQQWNDLGDGFPYSSYPSKLLEYNGYLLINEHPVSYNGTVNGLVAWDGQQYHGMGQITCENLSGVGHMTLHDGKLWVAGDCTEPLPGFHHYFASYDGERWCRYDFVEKAQYMTVFQDRMYAYLLHYPNGPVHRFVRWLDETEPDWCGEPMYMGVNDAEATASEIKVFPNPTTSTTTITWQGQNHGNYQLQLFDAQGRRITPPVTSKTNGEWELDMRGLAPGIYFGRLVVGDPSTSSGQGFKVVRE